MKNLINHRAFICILAFASIPSIGSAETTACNMKAAHNHVGTAIFSAANGTPSIYYHANMDVNTDGTARSYHPDDPRGKNIAYNNMGNAITKAWNVSGKQIVCDGGKAENRKGQCFEEFISAFEGARNNKYNPSLFPKFETEGIIPWKEDQKLGWQVPCRIQNGPNEGFFVSQTTLPLNDNSDVCDINRYVDSLTINAVVYPKKTKWYSQGVYTDKGDLVVARNRATGHIAFALHGDAGSRKKIGEGSIALVVALSGKTISPDANYSEIKKLTVENVDYLIFPTHDVEKFFKNNGGITQSRINEYGKKTFEAWGGISRLDACSRMSKK